MVFTDKLDSLKGISDAKIIERPLGNLDELDSLELQYVRSSIPITHADEAAFDNPEKAESDIATKVQPGDLIFHKLKDNRSIKDAVTWSMGPQLSPNFNQAREKQEQTIMRRQGLPDYTRGVATGADLATELSLINQALQSRQGWKIAACMKVMKECGQNTIGLFEEFLNEDSLISIRVGKESFQKFQRAHLSMRDPAIAAAQEALGEPIEPPLQVDYSAVMYQPASNTNPARLGRIVQAWPIISASPIVNQKKLMMVVEKLLDLDEDILYTEKELQEMAMAGQQAQAINPAGQAGKVENGESTDTPLNGGGLPYDVAAQASTQASPDMAGGAGAPMPGAPQAQIAGGA
jgi:hypothetical protein